MADGSVLGRVGNITPYAKYVQGFDDQAWMHKGTWQTEKEVLEQSKDEIVAAFESEIAAVLAEG